MKDSIIIGLLQNTAILLAFAMIYENIWLKKEDPKNIKSKIFAGLLLSLIGVIIMFTPWTMSPGLVFDTRSVILSVSGLFFGAIPTIILMIVTSIVRLIIGGDGQLMGIAVIITSGAIGLLWRKFRPNWKDKNPYFELLALGIIVHIIMSACTILLPQEKILLTLKTIALPLILIYSPATMLFGLLLLKQYKNWQNRFAQAKLRESEQRLSRILESGNIVSLLLNKDGKITFCNNYLLEITGYSKDEIIGQNWFDILIPNNIKNELFKVFSDDLQNKKPIVQYENEILSKTGQKIYISWYNSIIESESNDVEGMACIGVNITDKEIYENKLREKNAEIESQNEEYRQLNEELQQSKEKAEESDRLKSAFLTNMSHEIRTPMNGILGFTNLLKERGLSGETQQEYISIIEKSGDRMLNTIKNIMDISMIESNQVKTSISPVDINEQTNTLFSFFKPEVEKKGMSYKLINTLNNEEATIKTDKEKVYAILTNLIKNSIKYSKKGSIEFGYNLIPDKQFPVVKFYIKDTGIGIPKDRQKAIFDRFVQADIEDKEVYEGSGLGLSISKAYVEMMGGKIWVESEVGVGSTFYFTLPYHSIKKEKIETDPDSNREENLQDTQDKKLKILIAEDEEYADRHLSILLKNIGKEFLHAKTGIEAVDLFKQHPDIDLILMDVKMPLMNGHEATKQIRKLNREVIIIAQTAYALEGDKEKAIEAGCDDYISKPIDKEVLLEKIGRLVSC